MKYGAVAAIEYFLPAAVLSTGTLASEFPEWQVENIDAKTGIRERHIAAGSECVSDLAVAAADNLFGSGVCKPSDVDFIILSTQSPDYVMPSTACLIQERLGIPTTAGAYDFHLGCSAYIYGLGQAEGLIATSQASHVLLLTADIYSRFIGPRDRVVRTIFGDAAAATLVRATEADAPYLGPFVYGTDGSGAKNLIVPAGGLRQPRTDQTAIENEDASGNFRSAENLAMDGGEIFAFTLSRAPESVSRLLERSALSLEAIGLFVFHQTNVYTLNYLRKKLKIPEEKFVVAMSHCGNTVSSSIPIALKEAMKSGRVPSGTLVMLVGFGVGYSWGATLLRAI